MKISIIGLGWFGNALAEDLKRTHEVAGTTRSKDKILSVPAEILDLGIAPSPELMQADVIVLNIPPFAGQLEWFRSWRWQKSTHVIFISSTSVYGEVNGLVDERTPPHPETDNAKLLVSEEDWIKTFPFYTIIRFAGLLGRNRHPGNFLSGRKNLSGGNQPVNLIHLEDTINFTKLIIENHLIKEVFNLVSPEHPTRRDFYQRHCREQQLALPEFEDSPSPGKIIDHKKASALYQTQMKLFQ